MSFTLGPTSRCKRTTGTDHLTRPPNPPTPVTGLSHSGLGLPTHPSPCYLHVLYLMAWERAWCGPCLNGSPFQVRSRSPWWQGAGWKADRKADLCSQEPGRLSGGDLGRLLSARHTVSLQQIFPRRCYKTCIWQSAAGLQALLSLVK